MSAEQKESSDKQGRPFLGVHFANCGVYGRLYRSVKGDFYVGNCPRCGHPLRVDIDNARGVKQRFFIARCP